MAWQFTVFSMGPVLVFAVVRRFGSSRAALGAAVAAAALELIINSAQVGFLEPFSSVSFVLFALLGGMSYARDDVRYFQLQPVAVECSLAATFLFYTFVYGEPLFAIIVEDYVGFIEWLAPWRRGYFQGYILTMSKSVPFLLLAHAAVTAYAAYKLSFTSWLAVRVLGFYAMLFLWFYGERLLGVSY